MEQQREYKDGRKPVAAPSEQQSPPTNQERGLFGTIKRLGEVAAAIAAIGGLAGDLLKPLASINLITFAIASALAVLFFYFWIKRVKVYPVAGFACFFFLCLAVGFGGWWALAYFTGGSSKGFVAEHIPLVGKIQSVFVTEKKVDGEELAKETRSQVKEEENATNRLQEELAILPSFLVVEVPNKPTFNRSNSSLTLEVIVKVDSERYRSYRERLATYLDGISVSKESVLIQAEERKDRQGEAIPQFFERRHDTEDPLNGPTREGDLSGKCCIWLASFLDQSNSRSRWNAYIVDIDVKKALSALKGKTYIGISLFDKDGTLVTEDEFCIRDGWVMIDPNKPDYNVSRQLEQGDLYPASTEDARAFVLPFLYQPGYRINGAVDRSQFFDSWMQDYYLKNHDDGSPRNDSVNIYIAPMSFSAGDITELRYQPYLTYRRTIKLSLQELDRIKNVKSSISYRTLGSKSK